MRNPLIAATLGLLLLADMAQAQTLVATSNILICATQRTLISLPIPRRRSATRKSSAKPRTMPPVLCQRTATFVAHTWKPPSVCCAPASGSA